MCAIAHSSFIVVATDLVLSCHLEEELLLENRCENSRSKISKIPRRSLCHGLRYTARLLLELHLEAFHIRELRF